MSVEYFEFNIIPVDYLEERVTTMIDNGLTILTSAAGYGLYGFLKIN